MQKTHATSHVNEPIPPSRLRVKTAMQAPPMSRRRRRRREGSAGEEENNKSAAFSLHTEGKIKNQV